MNHFVFETGLIFANVARTLVPFSDFFVVMTQVISNKNFAICCITCVNIYEL